MPETGGASRFLMESGLTQLPEGFGRLSKLEKLWLSQNALRQLPADFGELHSLQALWLGDTLFKEVSLLQNILDLCLFLGPVNGHKTSSQFFIWEWTHP